MFSGALIIRAGRESTHSYSSNDSSYHDIKKHKRPCKNIRSGVKDRFDYSYMKTAISDKLKLKKLLCKIRIPDRNDQ